jgi:O-antigen biosynthesis protein
MTTTFPPLPQSDIAGDERRRICIATWEIEGPSRNAGIGSAYASLATALRRAGHQVTILFLLGCHPTDGNIIDWIDYYERQGLTLIPLPMAHHPRIHAAWASSVSYHTYQWLKDNQSQFDIIHFPECQGLAFYSLLAKRQGLAFRDITFVISTHGPTLWVKEGSQDYLRNLGELEIDFMERTSVSAADVVVSPSQYLLGWMQQNGWELPAQTYIAPYVLPERLLGKRSGERHQSSRIQEIVFFGRLEIRKGLKLFCDALDQLSAGPVAQELQITFLGKETQIYGHSSISYICDRSKQWSMPWRIASNKFRNAAVDYLDQPGRLAVVASLSDNFPNTVLECAGAGIPLLASNVGGIPEIIDPADHDSICFEPRPGVLAERLRAALQHGAHSPRPSASFADTEHTWVRWHTGLKHTRSAPAVHRRQPRAQSIFPLVSVCFAYDMRQGDGAATLASLQQQDYPHFEIIIAECGNNGALASEGSDEGSEANGLIAKNAKAEKLQRFRLEGAELGAARNTAVEQATGEYLFFVDDHTLLLAPNTLSVFVQVAQRVNADIVTSAISFFFGSSNGDSEARLENSRRIFLGGDVATGAFVNCFGSTNALVRRDAFDKVGGFSEEAVSTIDDWEFMAKAVLMGLAIETMPEVFVWQREDQDRDSLVHSLVNAVRSVRPYILPGRKLTPEVEQNLARVVQFGQGLKFEADAQTGTPLSRGEQGPAVTG